MYGEIRDGQAEFRDSLKTRTSQREGDVKLVTIGFGAATRRHRSSVVVPNARRGRAGLSR